MQSGEDSAAKVKNQKKRKLDGQLANIAEESKDMELDSLYESNYLQVSSSGQRDAKRRKVNDSANSEQ
jgi:hypothetical protein